MPTEMVTFTPGVNVDQTPALNQAAYQATQLIRWDPGSGLPQKIGGWTPFYPTPFSSEITAMHAWEDLSAGIHLGVGSMNVLGVITSGVLDNITPQTNITNPAVSFSTVINTTSVVVNDTGSNATIYDSIILNTPVSVGGIVLSGAYPVASVSSANQYTIIAASPATGTVTNGGAVPSFTTLVGLSSVSVTLANHGYSVGSTFTLLIPVAVGGLTLQGFYTVNSITSPSVFVINATNQASSNATVSMNSGNAQILYYITPGPSSLGAGYGDGGYGEGGYGNGVAPPPFTGTPITALSWTLDNFGAYLIACPLNGPIFAWQPQSGLFNAQMIAQAPTVNTGVFVAMQAEIIVAYGSSVLGVKDPMLINWCSAGNFNIWTAGVANLAGSYRLSRGSAIVGGLQGPQYGLIWTDLDVWSMTFIGYPNVFGFTTLGEGCGLIAQYACGVLGTTVYWMSQKQFYALPTGGSVTPLPCTVWDFVFSQLDTTNLQQIRCACNSQFGEVTWYFPVIGGGGANTAYVKFTPQFSCWDYGYLGRSAWIDQSVLGSPIGADSATNLIYQHETSADANGQPMNSSFTTGYWALSGGEEYMFCDLAIPDMKFGGYNQPKEANVGISFTYASYPTGQTWTTPVYSMQANGPPFINPRFRAKLTSMTVGSGDIGSWWRLGGLRLRLAPDGKMG